MTPPKRRHCFTVHSPRCCVNHGHDTPQCVMCNVCHKWVRHDQHEDECPGEQTADNALVEIVLW